jgi:hypothetical protein
MDNGQILLVNLAKARKERLKQLLLSAYRKAYPKQVRQGEPLPPKNLEYIVQNKTHLEMQYITNIYSIINNFMNYICSPSPYNFENEFHNKIKSMISKIDTFFKGIDYKYGISGSNAWYNLFGDIAPTLSDYELSAINKYNTKEYLFFIRNTSSERLDLFKLEIIRELKKITDYLNINIQKALGELIGNEEFSYFNGKEVFVGFKPYLNEKKLLDNAFSFSIILYIAKPDAIIPENEIIINNTFRDNQEFDIFISDYKKLELDVANNKKRNGPYLVPTKYYQLASYIGKYKIYQMRYIDDYFNFVYDPIPGLREEIEEVEEEKPKIERRKRKTRQEEEDELIEEQYAKALNRELQQAGRNARARLREIARNDAPKVTRIQDGEQEQRIISGVNDMMSGGGKRRINKKKGGEFNDDDPNGFVKIKLFTFTFNYFDKIRKPTVTTIEKELEEKENQLFDNFDKLLAKKEEKHERYFGIEGLYILNKIMDQKVYIQRNRYNPYKIRNYIFEKFILSEYYPKPIQKIEKMWYITDIFEKTFKQQNIVKEFVYNNMKKDILEVHPELKDFKEKIESDVIELFRPYINKTIFNINDELSKMEFYILDVDRTETEKSRGDEKLTGVFILGGDALNRYKYNATKTNDIDAKIYIPMKIPYANNDKTNIDSGYHNEEKIFRCITSNLIKLLAYLENNKKTLFEKLQTPEISHKEISEGSDDNKYIVDVNFVTDDPKFVNFKFRKSGKPSFPVDLYSIDYKCEFKITISDKIIIIPINIAFIDVVVKQEGKNIYNKFSVFAENKLPLARLEFLLSDLLNTYNENDLSLLRFFAGKSDKDYIRLNLLWNLYFQQKSDKPIYSIDSENIIHFRNETNQQNNERLNAITNYTVNTSSIDEGGDKLYISIMQILNGLIEKRKIKRIAQFSDYENPNLYITPVVSMDTDVKTGGRAELMQQNTVSYYSNNPQYSEKYIVRKGYDDKYMTVQPYEEEEKIDIDYRYNENNITKDLMSLMNVSFTEMEQKIAYVDEKDFRKYNQLDAFNNQFYSEFVKILKPEYKLKNDDIMTLKFTRLARNMKRLDENTNIFFGKKKMSERVSSKINKKITDYEEDNDD